MASVDNISVNIQSDNDETVSGSGFDDVTTSSAIHGGGYLKDITYPSLKKKPSTRSVLPSRYNSKVSVVENQGNLGVCWTFAFNAVLESALMKKNNTVDPYAYNFSEEHMRYMLSNQVSDYGFNRTPDAGGYFDMAAAYMMRGVDYGAVEDWRLRYYETNRPYTADELNNVVKEDVYVKNTMLLGKYDPQNDPDVNPNAPRDNMNKQDYINAVKQAVYQYGAVSFHFKCYKSCFHSKTHVYYYNEPFRDVVEGVDYEPHLCAIVGWIDHFGEENMPDGSNITQDGVFIVKNSWGTDWGDDGFFYIPYDFIGEMSDLNTITSLGLRSEFDNIYEHDEYGYYQSKTVVNNDKEYMKAFVNRFETKTDVENVKSINIYNPQPNSYIKFYISPSGNFEDLKEVKLKNMGSGTSNGYYIADMGYHYLELETPERVTGDYFLVGAEIYNPDETSLIPETCKVYDPKKPNQITETSQKVKAASGETFLGASMSDIANNDYFTFNSNNLSDGYNNNVCLKAYTTVIPSYTDWRMDEMFSSGQDLDEVITAEGLTITNPTVYQSYPNGKICIGANSSYSKTYMGGLTISSNGKLELDAHKKTVLYIAAEPLNPNVGTHLVVKKADGTELSSYICQNRPYVYKIDCGSYEGKLSITCSGSLLNIYEVERSISNNDTNKIYKEWNFSDPEFADLTVIRESVEIDGLRLNASNEKTMKMIRSTTSTGYNNCMSYGDSLDLCGEMVANERSVSFYVPHNTLISATVRTSAGVTEAGPYPDENYTERTLMCVDGRGNIVSGTHDMEYGQIKTITFRYTGSGENVYLCSSDKGIRIFSIKLKPIDDSPAATQMLSFEDSTPGIFSSTVNKDGFNLVATEEKDMRILKQEHTFNGNVYTKKLCLYGEGKNIYRNVNFETKEKSNVTVIAGSPVGSAETRKVMAVDKDGNLISEHEVTSLIEEWSFTVEEDSSPVYIMSEKDNIWIYSIQVIPQSN